MNRLIHIVFHIAAGLLLLLHPDIYPITAQEVRAKIDEFSSCQPSFAGELSTRVASDNQTSLPDSDKVVPPTVVRNALGNGSDTVLPDSSEPRTYRMPEVVVTSARVYQTVTNTPSFITVIKQDEISASNATSLAQVLSPVAGIFIKDYGAASGLKTISQRGLGTEHTLILLNGMRVSSMQNGLVDLGLLSVDEIGGVEIVRGGQSASYGADAVAGLVNVTTKPVDSRNSAHVVSSVGSFGYQRYLISGSLSSGVDGMRLSFGQERSQGNFPFQFHNGPLTWNLVRQNADLLARHANVQGGLMLGDRTRVGIVASAYSSERGAPGAIVSPYGTSHARQIDTDHLIQTSLSSGITEDLSFAFSAQAHFSYERYRDPNLDIGGTSLDTYFRNDDVRLDPHVDVRMSDGARVSAGIELASTTANGNSLDRYAVRKQLGAFIAGEITLLTSEGAVQSVSMFPILRHDVVSSARPVWSPQIGALVRLQEFAAGPLRRIKPAIRSSVSRNFRMPTFNELYFSGGGGFGDPALRPERSTSVDVGGSLEFSLLGEQQIQTTYYRNDMIDRIVWTESAGGSVVPKNLRRVRSTGLEANYRWDFPDKVLSLQLTYTTSVSRKISADYPGDPTVDTQLPYVPGETLSLSANSRVRVDASVLKEVGIMLGFSFVGYRYVTQDNSQYLPSYQLLNAGIRGRAFISPFFVVGKLEVNNLFDYEYEIISGYPMPRRSYRATFEFEY